MNMSLLYLTIIFCLGIIISCIIVTCKQYYSARVEGLTH
jgi:hypothetical protein